MGLFNNKPKKLKPKRITLAQAIEYAKDPEYNMLYEFMPINPDNLQAGYIPRLKQEILQDKNISTKIDKYPKAKRNQGFINRIEANGTYKGIDQGVSKKIEQEVPKYGDYKSAKRYKGDIR